MKCYEVIIPNDRTKVGPAQYCLTATAPQFA